MSEFFVATSRGPLVESMHEISAVVADASGRILAQAGHAELVTYWRSAAKPFQLLPLLRDGGLERFPLDAQMLALACGSHNAESIHREVCHRWLHTINLHEADLACGGHPSLWPALADAMIHDDVTATPVWSNCSGKHAAMLAQARLHDWGTSGYQERAHPVQQRIADIMTEWTGIDAEHVRWGVDGCTAAAVALPLHAMATAYARLATSHDPGATAIRDAMMSEPYMVAGDERLDTVLMQAWPGAVVAKIGAEGVYSAALPGLGLGVALKVHDGDMLSAGIGLMSLLTAVTGRLAGDAPWPLDTLGPWIAPDIRNTRGDVVGARDARGGLRWL
jgi:L-asparaginase II